MAAWMATDVPRRSSASAMMIVSSHVTGSLDTVGHSLEKPRNACLASGSDETG